MPATRKNHILVIKLGALGDFIQALGPMAAIRRHHSDAHITLLTTAPFEKFAAQCGYFNEIWIDAKPRLLNVAGWMKLKKKLNSAHFIRVYDLQNNDRTAFYFSLFSSAKKPEWVGTARGASHRNNSSERIAGHAFDGHVQTLALAGIKNVRVDTLGWLEDSIASFPLHKPYMLLVPGSAPEHPQKRWPAAQYGRLAAMLTQWGYQPVIIGTKTEEHAAAEIAAACPGALDLTGLTSLAQVVTLARGAAACVGNDTGPLHMIAATGCPTIALFSSYSNPVRHAPKGDSVQILREKKLADLRPENVLEILKPREEPQKKSDGMH